MLDKNAIKGEFDKLIIVASRPLLSSLRSEMHQEVNDKLILDIPKVLTNHPMDEIEQLIEKEMADS